MVLCVIPVKEGIQKYNYIVYSCYLLSQDKVSNFCNSDL